MRSPQTFDMIDDRDESTAVQTLPDWARSLDLSPHPEGGWFRETWRSALTLGQSSLPAEYDGPRSAGTAILFLLMPNQHSAWHRVTSAELWFFHRGSPLAVDMGDGKINCDKTCNWPRHRSRTTSAASHSTRTLATRLAPRRRTYPGQLCGGAGL
ncbi:conserved hypothetical protein [Mycobacterium ulcerans Agy99]|uniref:DUF985 domain-containing protein n=1 Tax=Mycobacterium ulcerans (strain Agy99) TaxID=362242 RepID=A0PVR9_MYCUA|nr:conserved hypothetical protein [Mycobacterium ulcerans Agy99]